MYRYIARDQAVLTNEDTELGERTSDNYDAEEAQDKGKSMVAIN